MSELRVRFGRHIRLPEIGDAGQERLCAREVTPMSSSGDAREVEVAYLRGAGMKVRAADDDTKPKSDPKGRPHAPSKAQGEAIGVKDQAARDVADGAFRALVAFRAVLGIGEPG